ncbi:MAG TPA: DNA-processing protein DprA [Polyangia bacterium]|nr:DNA-processing protein DprA [Polyangia bacterium]
MEPCPGSSFFSVARNEPTFPAELRQLSSIPTTLWVSGRLPSAGTPAIAIVGSRAATTAACRRAEAFARAVAGAGYDVVSGGALGIDAAAHRGALAAGGATFAVLGCGIDVVYPDRHAALFAEIAITGGVLTELEPGTQPKRQHFPSRNRLVAALAGTTIVVEARDGSGALITANFASKLGRRVLAVPGSAGCDALLAAGRAEAIEDAAGLLDRLAGRAPVSVEAPTALAAVVAALRAGAATPSDVARRMAATLPATLALLAEVELAGWVRRAPGGKFEVLRAN